MADRSSAEAHDSDFLKFWSEKISSFRVPIVAAEPLLLALLA
ncbi:hypothetical protein MJO28_007651 [Puccinia striiformis f. sp. tritici]|uniref:Uncharacterized protein n=1 Tax=Puccinia striiformis f. sp. tritici TaxID=168172 RepID=A0ACC0EGK5_9BASI|nr:hypothetical protein MJO28_007651 [Puccinia striiformis f. sp. tritici]KAI7956198.1 hypothetical protein MJO29_007597 [Puccinia striiformis f. sp. tritici]